jgi:hypothetical protein
MYLCGAAYNALPQWAWDDIISSTMLPRALTVTCITLLVMIIYRYIKGGITCLSSNNTNYPIIHVNRHAASWYDHYVYARVLLFMIVQTLLSSLLGIGIMRLMMLGTISCAILSSLCVSPSWLWWCWSCIIQSSPKIANTPIVGVQVPKPPSHLPPVSSSSSSAANNSVRTYPNIPSIHLKRFVLLLLVPLLSYILYQRALPQLQAQFTRASTMDAGASNELVQLATWIHKATPVGATFAASPIVSVCLL